ncbi:hypothetical protein A3L09_02895 [Thermococcus profundus]|uniref:Tetratricopeptide repeat protein n=2 Tax=Thermococcus profundus TaxID=49899 RepID=A0A2Z2MDQ2_THEPR|nr:hypothetical protein A3L09_02895 [Thermococcus profundus]
MASPEDLEHMGFEKLEGGEIKEGLKLILRAAKKYEDEKKLEDAARLYYYFGYFFLNRLGKPEMARKPLLKSASLYIKLIEAELDRFEVDMVRLNEFCSKTLSVFATVGDERNLKKYAKYFAEIYEDLGKAYMDNDEVENAIRAYEDAFRYYKALGDPDSTKRIADSLITAYGRLTEEKVAANDSAGAAEAFYRLSFYLLEIFGYDTHYVEIMDTAARNYEKASKVSYSQGDLDGTTTHLLNAQYAYMLAGNSSRAKLIGINNIRMAYQVVGSYQRAGDDRNTARKLLELAQALLAVGKYKEAFKAYHEAVRLDSRIDNRIIMRAALLKIYGAEKRSAGILSAVGDVEYYLERGNRERAIELADGTLRAVPELESLIKMLHEAEGISVEE